MGNSQPIIKKDDAITNNTLAWLVLPIGLAAIFGFAWCMWKHYKTGEDTDRRSLRWMRQREMKQEDDFQKAKLDLEREGNFLEPPIVVVVPPPLPPGPIGDPNYYGQTTYQQVTVNGHTHIAL